MTNKRKQFDLSFKKDAVQYVKTHTNLTHEEYARNLGIGKSTLSRWLKETRENGGEVSFTGSGNYSNDLERENARLLKELKNTKDALDI